MELEEVVTAGLVVLIAVVLLVTVGPIVVAELWRIQAVRFLVYATIFALVVVGAWKSYRFWSA